VSKLPRPSLEAESYIQLHSLVYTDLRFSAGLDDVVADTVQIADDPYNYDSDTYRRLLLVDGSAKVEANKLWETAAEINERDYLRPKLLDNLGRLAVYQIPLSSRPYKYEMSLSAQAKNDVDAEKIAESTGYLLGKHYVRTGKIYDSETLYGRLMVVDFLGSKVEPIFIAPPIKKVRKGLEKHSSAYVGVFKDSKQSSSVLKETFDKVVAENDRK
jgi:hypothetical protein